MQKGWKLDSLRGYSRTPEQFWAFLASFHLKSDFMANMTFQVHFLMNPEM